MPSPDPVREVGAHWLCPDGDRRRRVGVRGELVSLELAALLGDDR
jgi:hypothetical protein